MEPLRASKALLAAGASPNTADFTSGQSDSREVAERSQRCRRETADFPSGADAAASELRASPLLREGLRDSRCAARQTPLHRLSDHGGGEAAAETLAALLDAGAHINVQDGRGHTPPQRPWPLPDPRPHCLLQDGRGHTPLHLAAWRGAARPRSLAE